MKKLDIEEFEEENYEELSAIFSENGSTMELDFDFEKEVERLYEKGYENSKLKEYPQLKFIKEKN
jgi:hypothetical protein